VGKAAAWKADALYCWPPQAALFALARGLPTILELHGEPEGRFGPLVFSLILKRRGRRRFLPITRALADLVAARFGYTWRPGEMVVSPNGVDLERFESLPTPDEARAQLGLPQTLTAGYTGHLYAGRGIGLLASLAERFAHITFVWVGGRPAEVETWRARLAEMGIQNVHLAGFLDNSRLPLYQAACDILLMPYERKIAGSGGGDSASYASPMKMFEYMACGRAILSSDLPVIREVLDAGNAVLCPPEDLEAWSAALQELADDPQKRRLLAERARQDVNRYTWLERARRALEGFLAG
jgi:glycosyltransferase involved in cell wall biosynthesis